MQRYNADEDARLAVKFEKRAVFNSFKSEQEGRKVFEDVDYIRIRIPGEKNSEVVKKVTDVEKQRFASRWEKYITNQESIAEGTPVGEIPTLSPAQVETLKSYNIETVEQLADLGEGAAIKLIHGRELKRAAEKFLDGENYAKRLEDRIKELELKLEGVKDEPVNDSPERPRRGRPRRKPDNGDRE